MQYKKQHHVYITDEHIHLAFKYTDEIFKSSLCEDNFDLDITDE